MQLDPGGAQLFPAAFAPNQILALENALEALPADRPGTRLHPPRYGEGQRPEAGEEIPGLVDLVQPATAIAASFLGSSTRPVRATLFDKSSMRNWALGWHQDRTIAVRARIETPGFAGWTVKDGIHHVEPPFEILAQMLTVRVHLDTVDEDNAPLRVVPGSQHRGRVTHFDIHGAAPRLREIVCLADRGDLWLYAALIFHASARATKPDRRRVLQLLYAAENLPGKLEWLGI